MKIEVKTATHKRKHIDRFGNAAERPQPVVEVWIDGLCCVHICDSPEQARATAIRFSYALGLV
jgi:hypothetical protein